LHKVQVRSSLHRADDATPRVHHPRGTVGDLDLLDWINIKVLSYLTSYLPRLFTKDMLTDPIGFLKNHLPEPRELEW